MIVLKTDSRYIKFSVGIAILLIIAYAFFYTSVTANYLISTLVSL